MNYTVFWFSLDVYQDSGIFQKIFLISLFLLISRNSMGNLFKSKILLYTAQGHHNCINSAFRQNSEYLFIVTKVIYENAFSPPPPALNHLELKTVLDDTINCHFQYECIFQNNIYFTKS